MKKTTIVPFIIFAILAGGLYYLLSTAHVDIFSGEIKKHDYFTETDNIEKASISLLDVSRGDASLDASGWMTAVGVIGGIPFVIALLIGFRMKRKARKRMLAQQQQQPQQMVS